MGEHLVNFPAFAQGNVRFLAVELDREGTNMPIPSWEAQLKNEVIKVYIATPKDKIFQNRDKHKQKPTNKGAVMGMFFGDTSLR